MKQKFARQLLVEIPEDYKNPVGPWYADTIKGFKNVGVDELVNGEWENSTDTVKVGDFLFNPGYMDEPEIHFTNEVFDSKGNPSVFSEHKSYALYEEVVSELDDCFGLELCDFISVFRPVDKL